MEALRFPSSYFTLTFLHPDLPGLPVTFSQSSTCGLCIPTLWLSCKQSCHLASANHIYTLYYSDIWHSSPPLQPFEVHSPRLTAVESCSQPGGARTFCLIWVSDLCLYICSPLWLIFRILDDTYLSCLVKQWLWPCMREHPRCGTGGWNNSRYFEEIYGHFSPSLHASVTIRLLWSPSVTTVPFQHSFLFSPSLYKHWSHMLTAFITTPSTSITTLSTSQTSWTLFSPECPSMFVYIHDSKRNLQSHAEGF